MRLTDILRKNKKPDKSAQSVGGVPTARPPVFKSPAAPRTAQPSTASPGIREPIFKSLAKNKTAAPPEIKEIFETRREVPPAPRAADACPDAAAGPPSSAREVFSRAVAASRDCFAAAAKSEKISVPAVVTEIVEHLSAEPSGLLLYIPRTSADHYVYSHSVNVCVLSALIAARMGFPDDEIKTLAVAAFFHDIGMSGVLDLAVSRPRLSSSEIQKIREHSAIGSNIAENLAGLDDDARKRSAEAILQAHERAGGGGYPKGVKNAKICEFAKILAAADTYEAMTHPRCYKEQMIPHEAVKQLINEAQDNFDAEVMKSFIKVVSLYPAGSYVKLSGGEIARVTAVNGDMPTRPGIKIIIDAAGSRAEDGREINLDEVSVVSIREAVDETKLKIDPKLLLELQTQRWWIM